MKQSRDLDNRKMASLPNEVEELSLTLSELKRVLSQHVPHMPPHMGDSLGELTEYVIAQHTEGTTKDLLRQVLSKYTISIVADQWGGFSCSMCLTCHLTWRIPWVNSLSMSQPSRLREQLKTYSDKYSVSTP